MYRLFRVRYRASAPFPKDLLVLPKADVTLVVVKETMFAILTNYGEETCAWYLVYQLIHWVSLGISNPSSKFTRFQVVPSKASCTCRNIYSLWRHSLSSLSGRFLQTEPSSAG